MNLLAKLTEELNAFLVAYDLPVESADEVLCGLCDDAPEDRDELTKLQIQYLSNFISRWDHACRHDFAPASRLDAYGCYVWLEDGSLICSEIGEFETHGKDTDYAVEVTAPESQDFLDAVNRQLGTDFRFSQFAGR